MSEHLRQNNEQETSQKNTIEHVLQKLEKELTYAERDHGSEKHIDAAAKQVEKLAHSSETHHANASRQERVNDRHPIVVNRELKTMAFSRAMTRVQKKLSVPSRTFSKLIHMQTVDRISEAASKTVARPSGFLGGAVFALAATSVLFWATRRYGYEYNYLIVIAVYAIGMLLGLGIDAAITIKRRNQESS
jgi:hypothetical protein